MKKVAVIVVALLIVVIAAVGAGAYWFGKQAEVAYNGALQAFAKNGQITIANSSFDRGWLSSTADVTLSLPGFPGGLSITSRIQNGPFPGLWSLKFMPGMAIVDSVLTGNARALAKLSGIKANTMIFLAGNSNTDIQIPAYREPPPGGLSWLEGSGKISVSADQQTIEGSVTLPEVQVASPTGALDVRQTNISWNRLPSPSGLGVGGYDISIARIAVKGSASPTTIEGVHLATSSRESAGSQTLVFSLSARSLKDGVGSKQGGQIGPGRFTMQLSKLDTKSLLGYQRDTQILYNRRLPPDKFGPAAADAFAKLLASLARKSPELDLTKLSVNVGGSEITGKGKFVLDGSNLPTPNNLSGLMQAIEGKASLFVPRAAVATLASQDIQRQLATYQAQGELTPDEVEKLTPDKVSAITSAALPTYMNKVITGMHLVPDGGDFTLTVAAHQGQWLVNDKPLGQPPSAAGGTQ